MKQKNGYEMASNRLMRDLLLLSHVKTYIPSPSAGAKG